MRAVDYVNVTPSCVKEFCLAALKSRNVREDVRTHVAASLSQTSLRGVDSHGIELLPHYIRAIDAGRLNPQPQYQQTQVATSIGRFDADHTFGHASGGDAMLWAIRLAHEHGVGAVSVYNSSHFGAAAYFSLLAARAGMIGLSFTHADSLMLSYGGVRPFFGTNPICFAVPCEQEEPFCLDMATTLVSWNKIRRYRENQQDIPAEWGRDAEGNPTTNPNDVVSLASIGQYKGFGLGMMIEILCGVLSGMPVGRDICRMYADPIDRKRYLGHFFLAMSIEHFMDIATFKSRLQALMNLLRNEPARAEGQPVMVPGDPEKKIASIRMAEGIPISRATFAQFQKIALQIGFSFSEEMLCH